MALQDNETQTKGSSSGRSSSQGPNKTQTLDEFGRDLTDLAREGKLDPVVGRQGEIGPGDADPLPPDKNNPCLIGDPGVRGRHRRRACAPDRFRRHSDLLRNKRIVALDPRGPCGRHQVPGRVRGGRMKKVMEEVRKSEGNVVLFIDRLPSSGPAPAEGAIDASNM